MHGRRPVSRSAAGAIVAICAIVVLAADQFTKYLTVTLLPYQQAVPVLGDFLQWYFVRNPGAAFSLGSEVTWIFTIALALVAVIIIWKSLRPRSKLWAVVLGGLLGGVLGNLTDRLLREPGFGVGHVIDMISTPWMWFIPGMSPAIYNVADIFIVTGMIAVALLVLVGLRLDGTREGRRSPDEAEVEASGGGPSEPDAASERD